MPRPSTDDYPAFYETYVRLVPEADLNAALEASMSELESDLDRIPIEKGRYAYGAGKWTVNQLLQHAIDTERIFAYRALCIARGEEQSLPGFDEKGYADRATATDRSLVDLKDEFRTVRISSIYLFRGFPPEALASRGTADGKPVNALAIGYMIIGHWRHHSSVLRDRYGII